MSFSGECVGVHAEILASGQQNHVTKNPRILPAAASVAIHERLIASHSAVGRHFLEFSGRGWGSLEPPHPVLIPPRGWQRDDVVVGTRGRSFRILAVR